MNNSLVNINYDVSTIAVDNSQFATLYHPVGADTSTYNTSQKALSPNDVTTVRAVISAPVPSKPWPTLNATPAPTPAQFTKDIN